MGFSRTSTSFAKPQGLEKSRGPCLEERLRSERARERQLQEDMERPMPSSEIRWCPRGRQGGYEPGQLYCRGLDVYGRCKMQCLELVGSMKQLRTYESYIWIYLVGG